MSLARRWIFVSIQLFHPLSLRAWKKCAKSALWTNRRNDLMWKPIVSLAFGYSVHQNEISLVHEALILEFWLPTDHVIDAVVSNQWMKAMAIELLIHLSFIQNALLLGADSPKRIPRRQTQFTKRGVCICADKIFHVRYRYHSAFYRFSTREMFGNNGRCICSQPANVFGM